MLNTPSSVISWAITEGCDARPICNYCIAKVNDSTRDVHPSVTSLRSCVRGLNRLAPSKIYINGGEPFAVPWFIEEVVDRLCRADNSLFVTSNFLSPVDIYSRFCEIAGTNLNGLNLSYHGHLFPDPTTFVTKVKQLKKLIAPDAKIHVSAVLHPRRLHKIMELDQKLSTATGIILYPQYFKTHDESGLRVLHEYDQEQMKVVEHFAERPHKSFPVSTSGISCWAGTRYIFIDSRGNVYRCQMYFEGYGRTPIGNIKNNDFQLIGEPVKCDFAFCGCGSAQQSGALVMLTHDSDNQDGKG